MINAIGEVSCSEFTDSEVPGVGWASNYDDLGVSAIGGIYSFV